jgi:hypothetical protein
MEIPNNHTLKARLATGNPDVEGYLNTLKANLTRAYKVVAKSNQRSHQHNKELYDRKAKIRTFEVNDLVYLYLPVKKPGITKKFARKRAGPFQVTKKISDLNYEIISQKDKKHLVHINRLKKAYNQNIWKPKQNKKL